MSITRKIVSEETVPDRKAELETRLSECLANDEWASKIFKKMAILIITYPGQRPYLRACVESHAQLGYFMAMTYDNYIDPKEDHVLHDAWMPDKDILDKIDLFLMPHHQTWKDTDYPFFWGLKWGVGALKDFEYIYCIDGDFVLDYPGGFKDVLRLMGDNDILTCGPDWDGWSSAGAFIVKTEKFLEIVQFMQDNYIPFENYERNVDSLCNVETRIGGAVRELGLRQKTVDKPLIWDEPNAEPGTWYELCGLRHIHGELDYAFKKRLTPPHPDYIDGKYLKPIYKYELIEEYWRTGDKEVLEQWWHK